MLYKYYRITYHQTDRIAEIAGDVGIVCIASVVFPSLFNDFSPSVAVFGTISALFFIGLSIKLSK